MLGLLITSGLLVVTGIWLIVADVRRPEHDDYYHRFEPDVPWGRIAHCAHPVWTEEGGEAECGLDFYDHEEVYGTRSVQAPLYKRWMWWR